MLKIVCDRCGRDMVINKRKFPFTFTIPMMNCYVPKESSPFSEPLNGFGDSICAEDRFDIWVKEQDESMRKMDLCPSCLSGIQDYIFGRVDLNYISTPLVQNSQS